MSRGFTGLILREWVERGNYLCRAFVYVRVSESYELSEEVISKTRLISTLKFSSVFFAHLFIKRYQAGQYFRCRLMIEKLKG